MRRGATVLTILVLLISGCGELRSPTEPLPDPPGGPGDPSATFTRVQDEIFSQYCAFSGCHGPVATQQGMELSAGVAYSNIVNVASREVPQFDRIEPGAPQQSYLYLKVTGAPGIVGERMPLGQPELTSEQKELVRNWILRGAPND